MYSVIEQFIDNYNIKALCMFFEVSRSGYYKWLGRQGKRNRYEQNREDLKPIVMSLHARDVTMGYRAINSRIIELYGWKVSDWLVHKVCKEMEVVSKGRKKWKQPRDEHIEYPNLIWGNWKASRPFEIIVSDTTTFYHKKTRKVYEGTFFLDVFNNEIVGYSIGEHKGGNNKSNHHKALESMLQNKKKRGYTNMETILHTDQGTVYASRAFKEAHQNYNITRSMSRSGTPTDNPIIESFNSWFKPLLYLTFSVNFRVDFVSTVNECINYWNDERVAYKNAYKNPVQYRTELGFL